MDPSPQGIPIIDLSSAVSEKYDKDYFEMTKNVAMACESDGCFYIKNHGIDYSVIDNYFDDFKTFFRQPTEYKLKYIRDFKKDRGYYPFESICGDEFMGRYGPFQNDPTERLAFGSSNPPDPIFPKNEWPDRPASLIENTEKVYSMYKRLSETLMRVFAYAIGLDDKDYFYRNCHRGAHFINCLFYPSSKPKPGQSARLPAHFDANPFTMLTTDRTVKAFQIKNIRGEWIYADPVPGAIFINLGTVMQYWTNDKWKATEHQVCWPEGESENVPERFSMGYVVYMNNDALIECVPTCVGEGEKAKFVPINFDTYIQQYEERIKAGSEFSQA